MTGFVGSRLYRGLIIPKEHLEMLADLQFPLIQARLRPGQKVRVRIESPPSESELDVRRDFIPAIVFDVVISNGHGVDYSLAFPVMLGAFYVVSPGFNGSGVALGANESAENSGIYSEEEFEAYLKSLVKSAPEPTSHLKVVK